MINIWAKMLGKKEKINVLSLFDGTNPIFCLVVIVEFCIFALWKNN